MRIFSVVRSVLFGLILLTLSDACFGQIGIAVSFGPPALPIYEQPLCPGDGYLWTPGYWAFDYDSNDYYWVPGTWVLAPEVGYLWTPPYWGWGDGGFLFYDGYWGPQIGFYGGINYGFGYFGEGFVGGRWDHDHFFYNRAVMNVNVTNIHNVYEERVTNVTVNRVSYNGGEGGITARPTQQQEAAMHERHLPPVAAQTQHIQAARSNPQLRASTNRGKPPVAATSRPGEFRGNGVVQAREAGGTYNPPRNAQNNARESNMARGENNAPRGKATHPNDLPPMERPAAPSTGNSKQDQKYQKQQEKLFAQQNKDRQKLQQQQEKEHQQLEKQNAAQERRQQVEQRHQQQTEQLQQRHTQQMQQMQQRQQPHAQGRPPRG